MDNEIKDFHLKELNNEPLLRIGIFDSQEYADFKVMGSFAVQDDDGNDLIKSIDSELKWRVKIKDSKLGRENFLLVLFESFDKELAEEKLSHAKKIDNSAFVRSLGGNIFFQNRKINNNTKYILAVGNYPTEIEARKDFKRFQPEFIPYVQKEIIKPPQGRLEVFDAEYDKSAESANSIRIVPEDSGTGVKIFNIRGFDEVLQKHHWDDKVFNGTLEFRIDNKGNLRAISELPLESYLKRVLYSEVGPDLPSSFLESFAVVCRNEAMARINHFELGDSIDFSNTGSSLRYYGDDFEDDNISKAVEATRGQILLTKDHIRDTPFHLICGGHTEDSDGFWENDEKPLFTGRYDWKEKSKNFSKPPDEKTIKKWIDARPEVWCNLKGREIPAAFEKYKQFFRWEVSYNRNELEDVIRKRIGEDIGTLFDIYPLYRGKSGRLKEIELLGSLKNYRINGQLNIRMALDHDILPSSCFILEKELDDTGTPIMFNFIGAGQGHGIGLCKTGAAVMALEGFKSEEILNHYFQDSDLKSIYEIDLNK
jgi:stage II sporulation protein D